MIKKKLKIVLHSDGCSARWNCKNVNKPFCNPMPKNGNDFVECEFYINSNSLKQKIIDKIKEKIMAVKNWLKQKVKKILIATGIIGIAVASGIALQPKVPFIEVNGQRIEFAYTDNNSNENLIIRTDKQNYSGDQQVDVYAMFENKSGIGQVINFSSFFADKNKSVSRISELALNVPYEVTIDDYGDVPTATGTSYGIIGNHKETRYKDEWQGIVLSTTSISDYSALLSISALPIKDKKGFLVDKSIQFPLLTDGISYFKATIEFPQYQKKEEFFIELVGSEGGYGHLDPWIQDATTISGQALANPTMASGTISSGTYTNTLISDDSRLIFSDTVDTGVASTSLKYAGLGTTVLVAPYDDNTWVTPENISADDAATANIVAVSYDTPDFSYVLKAQNFGFAIPTTATINGVVVEIEGDCDDDTTLSECVEDEVISLLDINGAITTANKWKVGWWDLDPTVRTYGASNDLWGETLTPAWLNNASSGIAIVTQATTTNAKVYIDYVRMTVYFTTADAEKYKLDFSFDGTAGTDQWADYTAINTSTIHKIVVTLEAKDSLSTDDYYALLYNFTNSTWDEVETAMSIGTTESSSTRSVVAYFASYLNTNKEIKVRIANGKALAKGGAPDNDGQLEIDYLKVDVSNWIAGTWLYRKLITIGSTDAVLTNFPVLVSLASTTNFDFSKASSTGADIRFTLSDGQTLLDFERETHIATSAAYWVEIPSVSSSTAASSTFYIYYGKADATDVASSTAVWDTNFQAVYHLKDLTTSSTSDSTVNNRIADKKAANEPIEASGKIAKGQDYDGTDDYIQKTSFPAFGSGDWLAETWFKTDTLDVSYDAILSCWEANGFVLYVDVATTKINANANGFGAAIAGTTNIATGTYYHTALMRSGAVVYLYHNGVQEASTTIDYTYTSTVWSIGQWDSTHIVNRFLNGIIDENRVTQGTSRTAAWIKASYNSGNDTLLTYGTEESQAVAAAALPMKVQIMQ